MDVGAVAPVFQHAFIFCASISAICPDIRAAVVAIDQGFELVPIVFIGRSRFVAANEFVLFIDAGVIFIAEVALAMFLRPGRITTGLALLGRSAF